MQRPFVLVVFLVVVFAWFGLVSLLSLCFFACLRSFTDWCIAHRQQSREQKKINALTLVPTCVYGLFIPSISKKRKCIDQSQIFE